MATTREKKVSRNHIHHDISLCILSKLPLKSLKRFACVRKSWALLFENPNFMTLFGNNITSDKDDDACLFLSDDSFSLLHGDRFQSTQKLEWPSLFGDNHGDVHILGSGITSFICLFLADKISVVLWNPATDESKVVPSDLVEPPPDCPPDFIALPILHGFGYDYVEDDYKLIRSTDFVPNHNRELHQLKTKPVWQIYSPQKNTWRNLDVDIRIRRHKTCSVGGEIYLNGVCHWLGLINDHDPCVVSFNLSQEDFIATIFPLEYVHKAPILYWMLKNEYLVVLYESVAIISYDGNTSSFHVYMLGEVGVKNSWTKLFVVGTLPGLDFIGTGINGDIFFRKYDGKLAYFDPNTQQVVDIDVVGGLFFCHLGIYKQSLLPIGGSNN